MAKRIKEKSFNEALCSFNVEKHLKQDGNSPECAPNLKSLHVDLFRGSKLTVVNDKDKTQTVQNASLFSCDLPAKDFIFTFFHIFDKDDATYRSRFLLKNNSNNGWGNRVCDALQEHPDTFIQAIERACTNFLKNQEHDPITLHNYLYSRLRIVIERIDGINDRWCDLGSREEHREILLHLLERISLNTATLFARLLVAAALRPADLTFRNLKRLLDNDQKQSKTLSCDKSYLSYLETRQADPQAALSFIEKAYNERQRDAFFEKEILSEYAMELLSSKKEEDRQNAVRILLELTGRYPKYGRGFYLLAECFETGCGCPKDSQKAAEYTERAAESGDVASMLFVALRARANAIDCKDGASIQRIKDCCGRILEKEAGARSSAYCRAAYLLGEICELAENDKQNALKHYRLASEAGYAPASAKVALYERKKRTTDHAVLSVQNGKEKSRHCFVSGGDRIASTVITAACGDFNLYTEQSPAGLYECTTPDALLSRLYGKKAAERFPDRLVFAFLEKDGDKNLNDALKVLDSLYNLTVDMEGESPDLYPQKRDRLMETVEICLIAPYEHAAMMIDASLCDMGGGLYFKVRILDENKDCAQRLLFNAPLFIPCLRAGDHAPNVVAFGNTPFIYEFVKEVTACCYMSKHKAQISAVGEGITKTKMKMMQEAPGLFAELPKEKLTPAFFDLSLDHPALPDALSGRIDATAPESMKAMTSAIQGGNYFVVDVGSDTENIAFARNLRSWILKNDPTFSRLPFIAVHCKDTQNAYLAKRLTVSSMGKGERWFNNYDLYCFGSANDLYSSILKGDITEELALSAHLYYYGFDNSRSALADYYLHSYSRDSSLSTALGLIYRMFNSGVYEADWRLYDGADLDRLLALAERFDSGLSALSEEEQDRLAAAEQARWNCFMLSRGWLCPTSRQVLAYMNESKDLSHKQELCKYHPYISDWDDLSDEAGSPFSILKTQIVQKTLTSPRRSTIKAVQNTLSLFVYLKTARTKKE